jgi:type II secretory pathway pseudopilin PulG
MKKAAMFGLDARIALAIFGALSVISGAALYNAIQESKVTSTLTSMQEVAKAVEQLILDTGSIPKDDYTNAANRLKATALIKDYSVANWNGPYLPYEEMDADISLNGGDYGRINLYLVRTATWSTLGSSDVSCRSSDTSCAIWVSFQDVDAEILKALETRIDGTATPGADNFEGKFRYASSIKDGGILAITAGKSLYNN